MGETPKSQGANNTGAARNAVGTYVRPMTRNVVGPRTAAYANKASAEGSGMPLATQAATDRAFDLSTRYGVNDDRSPNRRNQERIRRAMINMWNRIP